ncbi:MAG: hypothetical protein WAV95_15945 [Azonexus sp.]
MALPATIQTIVKLIGHGDAMALVRELGGQEFRFPMAKNSEKWEYLVEIVGPLSAGNLLATFSGSVVYIALCTNALRDDRDRRMIDRYERLLRERHSSRGAISILVQEFRPISNRTVRKIVNGPTPSMASELVAQGNLF